MGGVTKSIAEALQGGQSVELPKLGTFKLTHLPERQFATIINGHKQTVNLPATVNADFMLNNFEASSPNQVQTSPMPVEETKEINSTDLHTRQSDIGYAELVGKKVTKEILSLVPENLARKYQMVPFEIKNNVLSVAMTDPENEEAFNTIRKFSGKIIQPFITTQDDLNSILDQYSGLQAELEGLVKKEEKTVENATKEQNPDEASSLDEDSPAAKVIGSLLKRAVREKASDVHIEPSEEEVDVRFRVDGVLRKVLALPKEIQSAVISRVKILANLKIDETRLPQDGRIQILLDGNKVDFRISTLPTVSGEKVVARVLDHSTGVLTLEQLGLRGRSFRVLEDNITKSHGMSLITGPTGSGKSTTLYAIIARIKDISINIITMEDPVEYRMPGVNQSQVNAKIGFTFANGLRSILRQDPNVVMVGEIRDRETADIAINAALTGHIVLSSLHTNDAAGALPRLLDMGIEPFLIISSTNAIVGQRLCRKLCDKCRSPATVKPDQLEEINQEIETLPAEEKTLAKQKSSFYAAKGCQACNNTGYRGRIGIFEVLDVTEPIKQLTLKRASASQILEQARKQGFISMKQDGILKALDGLTSIEEVWRVTKD